MISALLGLAGGVASSYINAGLQREQNARNEALARQQNRWRLEQWRNEMAYNTPSAQIQRLRQAGLNPALVYSNGIDNLAPASPEMVSSQGVAPNIGNPFSNFAQNLNQERLLQSQIAVNESVAEKNKASAGLINVKSKHGELLFEIDSNYLSTRTQIEIDKAGQEFKNLQQVFDNLKADYDIKLLEKEKLDKYIKEQMPAEIKKIAAEAKLSEAQAEDIVKTFVYRVALLKAQANEANSKASLAQAQADYQNALNSIPGYYQAVVTGLILDNQGKLVSQAINIGSNRTQYSAGLRLLNGTDDPMNIDNYDKAIYTLSEIFGTVGRLMGISISN